MLFGDSLVDETKSAGKSSLVSLNWILLKIDSDLFAFCVVFSNLNPGGKNALISTGLALLKIAVGANFDSLVVGSASVVGFFGSSDSEESSGGGLYPGGKRALTSSNFILNFKFAKGLDLVLPSFLLFFSVVVVVVVTEVDSEVIGLLDVVVVAAFFGVNPLRTLKPFGSSPVRSSNWMVSNKDLLRSVFGLAVVLLDDGTNFLVNGSSSDDDSVVVDGVLGFNVVEDTFGMSKGSLSCDGNALRIPLESSDCTCNKKF